MLGLLEGLLAVGAGGVPEVLVGFGNLFLLLGCFTSLKMRGKA